VESKGNIKMIQTIFSDNLPVFKFAIREDLKDCGIDFLPTRAEPFATGWDVKAAIKEKSITLYNGDYVKIPLGFRAFCPDGWWLELKPRSSTFAKKYLHCLYGTIDTTFEGPLLLCAQYLPPYNHVEGNYPSLTIEFGEALGQIIPVERKEMKVEEVTNEEYDALCKSRNAQRGAGGFGSTS
jgi:dUTPase